MNTVSAETYIAEMQYGDYLSYKKVDEDENGTYDYIEITGCDKSVTEVEIPSKIDDLFVTSIGYLAFEGCGNLTSIEIPDSVNSIGSSAFADCGSLTSIKIPDSVTSIGHAFDYTPWLDTKRAENPLVIVNSILIDGQTCSGEVVIPDSVISIGEYAFNSCSSIENITIPDSVTTIRKGAFKNCTSLSNITIPDSVTTIESVAFYECSSLASITIPDGVLSIGYNTFYNCTSLANITIGNPECEIYDDKTTICNSGYGYNGVIRGYKNSIVQAYAEKYDYKFEAIDEEPPVTTAPPTTTITTNTTISTTTTTSISTTETSSSTTTTTETSTSTSATEPPVTTTIAIIGDISGNDKIDLQEAILISKSLLGLVKFTDEEIKIADYNKNGRVDLQDAIGIAKFLLKR